MARTIYLHGRGSSLQQSWQGIHNLLEAVGLELVERETRIRENRLGFKQTERLWVLDAGEVTVQLRHFVVETGNPLELREDDLWAEVRENNPQTDENEADY